jgi:hypothetical protein
MIPMAVNSNLFGKTETKLKPKILEKHDPSVENN